MEEMGAEVGRAEAGVDDVPWLGHRDRVRVVGCGSDLHRLMARGLSVITLCVGAFVVGLVLGTIQLPVVIAAKLIKNPPRVAL